MTISLLSKSGGSGGVRLAPYTNYPDSWGAGAQFVSDIFDCSGSLTTVLNLTEAHVMQFLALTGMPTSEVCTVKLVIDGETIWNNVDFTPSSSNLYLWGYPGATSNPGPFYFLETLVFSCKTASDTTVARVWGGHPIKV